MVMAQTRFVHHSDGELQRSMPRRDKDRTINPINQSQIMKINLKHHNVRSSQALDSFVENQITGLQPALQIDEAHVALVHHTEASPPFEVKAHLVTPGPDVHAEARDHTLQAAFRKMMKLLREKIGKSNKLFGSVIFCNWFGSGCFACIIKPKLTAVNATRQLDISYYY